MKVIHLAEYINRTTQSSPKQPIIDSQTQLRNMWLHGRCKNTRTLYERESSRFINYVHPTPLTDITLTHIQEYLTYLSDTLNLAPASISVAIYVLKSLFRFGKQTNSYDHNPALLIKSPPQKNNTSYKVLSIEQLTNLINAEPNKRNKLLLRILYFTGARVSEICDLKWQDAQVRARGGQLVLTGKGNRTRSVLLPVQIWQELQGFRNGAADEMPIFASRQRDSLTGAIRPLTRRHILEIIKQAARRISINDNISPHWFRHTHATHALSKGVPLHVLQTTLGHASIATTGKYLHAQPTDSSSCYLELE